MTESEFVLLVRRWRSLRAEEARLEAKRRRLRANLDAMQAPSVFGSYGALTSWRERYNDLHWEWQHTQFADSAELARLESALRRELGGHAVIVDGVTIGVADDGRLAQLPTDVEPCYTAPEGRNFGRAAEGGTDHAHRLVRRD
jgi:hypothetical protein